MTIPPHIAGTIQLLSERGHTVTVRENKYGSNRYQLDGGREWNALQLSRFYERAYE